MLVLLGFGFQNQAKGQIGLDGLFCPAVPNTVGWLETEIVSSGADFTGALVGTIESVGGDNVAGLDWHHVDFTSLDTPTPTNESGSQLVSWWTQKNERNTYLQVTNDSGSFVTVHVRIQNENCEEIRDFCDTYTPYDTHEYNFSDMVANDGSPVFSGNLQGEEGWLVVTAVENCATDGEVAIDADYLSGQLIVHSTDNDYLYGTNTYARQAVCFDSPVFEDINLVQNGSFETGAAAPWSEEQGNTGVINSQGISPNVQPPDGDFMAYVASSARDGFTSDFYLGGSFPGLADLQLINTGTIETNVSVFESAVFSPDSSNTATYALSFLAPSDAIIAGCDNYAAVLLIDANDGTIEDAECYNEFGFGTIPTNIGPVACKAATDDNVSYSLSPFEFSGGRSNFFFDSLSIPSSGDYAIQVVTGQIADGSCDQTFFNGDTGALVDDFEVIETQETFIECDGTLTGAFNAMLDQIQPSTLAAQFNILPGNTEAGADVVHINFADSYGPPYLPVAALTTVEVSIFDELENDVSCGRATVCFARLGIDDALVASENFNPVTPTPTPTITPTPPPPTETPTPTPTPSPTQRPSGSSSCAIAASPVQLGTALANVLIPLVPVAFAFGVRAVRRRKK